MIVTPFRGNYLVRPGPRELARLNSLNAMYGAGMAANPRDLPQAGKKPLLVPHFWTGDPIPDYSLEQRDQWFSSNGYVVWEGLSPFTGDPIALIATGFKKPTDNGKTGFMVQTWIIRTDMHPQEAVDSGGDNAVCANCVLAGGESVEAWKRPGSMGRGSRKRKKVKKVRGLKRTKRVCYVQVSFMGPGAVYKTYKAGGYPKLDFNEIADAFALGAPLRIGSYGEPTAVPEAVWREALKYQRAWTGYTHQWNDPRFQGFRDFCMASVDTVDESIYAQKVLGWSTYRLGGPEDPPMDGLEIVCPYEREAGLERRLQCDSCGHCTGRERVASQGGGTRTWPLGIVDPVHGSSPGAFAERVASRGGFFSPEGTWFPQGYFAADTTPRQELWMYRERRRNALRRRRAGYEENPGHHAPTPEEIRAKFLAMGAPMGEDTYMIAYSEYPTVRRLFAPQGHVLRMWIELWGMQAVIQRWERKGLVEAGRQMGGYTRVRLTEAGARELSDRMHLRGELAMDNPGHAHPHLRYPVPRDAIHDQLHDYRERAGLPGYAHVAWPNALSRTHERNQRRYAQVFFAHGPRQLGGRGAPRYEFAEQARWLPAPHRRGLIAHEVGHELAGPLGSEEEADQAVRHALGVKIGYDRRWPGKGLQRAGNPRPYPDPVEGHYFERAVFAWWGTDPSQRVRVQVLGPAWRGHLEYWNVIDPWEGDEITVNSTELFTASGVAWRVV
jgi:hypothetical protein